MALTKLARPLFSTTHHTPLVKAKLEWRANGCDPEEANRLVDNFYRSDAYAVLRGQPNIYLVVASTSGLNLLPLELAVRLQRDFGGEILEGFSIAHAERESKSKVR